MLNQKVSVDVWAMFQSMLGYSALAILGGIFIRLIVAAFTLPSRLRQQKDKIQKSLDELKVYTKINICINNIYRYDIKNALRNVQYNVFKLCCYFNESRTGYLYIHVILHPNVHKLIYVIII